MQAAGDDCRPSRLVARAQPGSIVAVEVRVEHQVVTPVRVFLKLLGASVDRPLAVGIRIKMLRWAGASAIWRKILIFAPSLRGIQW